MISSASRTTRFTTTRRVLVVASLSLATVAPAGAQAPASAAPLRNLDAYVGKAMKEWNVPGLAIAVVKDDSVVLARGYGVRSAGQVEPVDAQTMFAIGSASKAFTAMTVAMLVDDGKVRWDDPVTRHLSGFQMFDPYVTRELTVRDALSHRSGLARGDLLWYGSAYDRDEILRRVRFLRPSWSLRSTFGYQNLMYLAAGQVVERASGKSWDAVVSERIFAPLGMTASNTSVAKLRGLPNVAQPHTMVDDTLRVVPYRNIDNIAPAGSINSNAVDMAKWVRFQLAGGKVGTKPLVSAGNFGEMRMPHTVIRLEGPQRVMNPEVHLMSYGLGWFLQDYRGRLVVQHGGNIDGMSALVAMMPEERLGLVILTNMNASGLPPALMYRAFDAYLNAPARDWSADMRKVYEGQLRQAAEAAKRRDAQRITGTTPSMALEKYAGTYTDSMYGEAVVRAQNGKLYLGYGAAFDGELEHWHYDTFRASWKDPVLGRSFITFVINGSAEVGEMKIEGMTDFQRAPAKADTTAAVNIAASELPKYTGKFKAKDLPLIADVQLVSGALKLTLPGQPAYTLVATSPTRFRLTGPNVPAGFFLEYALDGERVRTVTLVQPAPQPTLVMEPVAGGGAR